MGDGRRIYGAVFPADTELSDQGDGRRVIYTFPYGIADYRNRIFMPGVFADFIAGGDLPQHLWQHDSWERPLGPVARVSENGQLSVTARFSDTPVASEVLTLVKDGALRFNSVRWVPIDEERVTRDGVTFHLQHKARLLDVGPVNFPGMPGTTITLEDAYRRRFGADCIPAEPEITDDPTRKTAASRLTRQGLTLLDSRASRHGIVPPSTPPPGTQIPPNDPE